MNINQFINEMLDHKHDKRDHLSLSVKFKKFKATRCILMSQSTTASAKGDLKLRIGLRKGCQNMKYYILL
jgi:hypothetical protein